MNNQIQNHLRTLLTHILPPTSLLVLFASGIAYAGINDGLIAWYPMEGNAKDVSGHGAHGNNHTGLVQYAPGKIGQAAWFDGQSSILLPQPRLLDGASNATISVWIRFASSTGGQILSSGDSRGGLDPISTRINPTATEDLSFTQITNNTQINMQMWERPLPGISLGTWHLFTLVLEKQSTQSVLRCYVDTHLAQQTTSTEFSHIAYDADMPALIGAIEVASPWQYWHGALDELRIYNRALSNAEVTELFYGGPEPLLSVEISHVRLCWNAPSNQTYQLQYRSELTTNQWANLGAPIPGDGTTHCLTDPVTTPRRFYRVVTTP